MKHYSKGDEERFRSRLAAFAAHPKIQKMKEVPQHKGSNSFAHCVSVTALSYKLAEALHLEVDTQSLIHGGMMHDLYLYDTETMPFSDYSHSMLHPKLALKNAEKVARLNERERNIILSHMWPIPGAPLPRSKEAWLVCLADKICFIREIHRKKNKAGRAKGTQK